MSDALPHLLLVLGMHRSGTSAATQMVQHLGAWLGDELIEATAGVNEAGFFENVHVVRFHEALLSQLGSAWYDPRPPQLERLDGEQRHGVEAQMEGFLASQLSGHPLVAVKDPRLCRLLPVWEKAIRERFRDCRLLLVIRHPDPVARSLARRDGLPETLSHLLWAGYTLEAERWSRGYRRCLVVYDRLLQNWADELERIDRELEIPWPVAPGRVVDQIAADLNPAFRHHTPAEAAARGQRDDAEDLALSVWNTLTDPAPTEIGQTRAQLDALWERFIDLLQRSAPFPRLVTQCVNLAAERASNLDQVGHELRHCRSVVEERDAQLTQTQGNLQRLGAEHSEALATIELRDQQLGQAELELERLGSEHSEALQTIAQRDQELEQRNRQLLEQDEHLADLQGMLDSGLVHRRQPADRAPIRTWLKNRMHRPRPPADAVVDVIVPVYRGYDDTRECLESVLRCPQGARFSIQVINDDSPEPAVVDYLQSLAAAGKIELHHNDRNLGFVATANRGMQLHPERDVVLLNSDAIVANDWLDRLRSCAYRRGDTGTVTPFSNNAEICSFPRLCKPSALPGNLPVARLDAAFAGANAAQELEIPTAIGFCTYIRRQCIQETGYFDEERFGRGYGEENDFSMRARAQGWSHRLAADVFVAHAGGVSFGTEKQRRIEAAMTLLDRLHPQYHWLVHEHIQQDPARPFRLRAAMELCRRSGKPVVLFVSHHHQGGTVKHIGELADCLAGAITPVWLRSADGNAETFDLLLGIDRELDRLTFRIPSQYDDLLRLLGWLGVRLVHFHHTMGVAPRLFGLHKDLGVPLRFTAHDYYVVNANPSLTDRRGHFCRDSASRDDCCATHYEIPGKVSAEQWRENKRRFLEQAEWLLTPSRYTAELLRGYFPSLDWRAQFHPDWERDAPYPSPGRARRDPAAPLRVVVLGALSQEKGAALVETAAIQAAKRHLPLEFHLLGFAYRKLHPAVIGHGAYQDEELDEKVQALGPHLIWFPARWPETYSYTLSAALRAGVPILAPDIGAFPERLENRPLTWLHAWDISADGVLAQLQDLARGPLAPGEPASAFWPDQPANPGGEFGYVPEYAKGLKAAPPARRGGAKAAEIEQLILRHGRRAAPDDEPLTARERVLLGIVNRLRNSPRLAAAMRAIPIRWQMRIKSLFTRRPMVDLDQMERDR